MIKLQNLKFFDDGSFENSLTDGMRNQTLKNRWESGNASPYRGMTVLDYNKQWYKRLSNGFRIGYYASFHNKIPNITDVNYKEDLYKKAQSRKSGREYYDRLRYETGNSSCTYCQCAGTSELDHFYPKELNPFISAEPYNLIPVCGVCNKSKSTQFPNIINSEEEWINPYFYHLQNPVYFQTLLEWRGDDFSFSINFIPNLQMCDSARVVHFYESINLEKSVKIALGTEIRSFVDVRNKYADNLRLNNTSRKKLIQKYTRDIISSKSDLPVMRQQIFKSIILRISRDPRFLNFSRLRVSFIPKFH